MKTTDAFREGVIRGITIGWEEAEKGHADLEGVIEWANRYMDELSEMPLDELKDIAQG